MLICNTSYLACFLSVRRRSGAVLHSRLEKTQGEMTSNCIGRHTRYLYIYVPIIGSWKPLQVRVFWIADSSYLRLSRNIFFCKFQWTNETWTHLFKVRGKKKTTTTKKPHPDLSKARFGQYFSLYGNIFKTKHIYICNGIMNCEVKAHWKIENNNN